MTRRHKIDAAVKPEPATTARRRGRPRTVGRGGALATVAADMVLSTGYDAMSLDAVIAQVGGSRRSIYNHFGGKEGLFVEAVTLLCTEVADPLRSLWLEDTEGDGRAQLQAFAVSLLHIVLAPRALALHRLMIAEGARFPALARAIWSSGHETAASMLRSWIGLQQERGLLRDGCPLQMAMQFVDLVSGSAQLRALVGLEICDDVDALARRAVDTFLFGLAIMTGVKYR